MKVLIVGSNEFLIKHVVEKYIKENYKVIRICEENYSVVEKKKKLKIYNKSLLANDIKHIFKANKFTEVIYIPSNDELNETFKLKNILDLSIRYKANKVTYISSQEVYGQVSKEIDESKPLNPKSLLGSIKSECESILASYKDKINILVIRKGYIYGEGYYKEVQDYKAWIYVSDFIEGLFRLASGNYEGVYNLSKEINTEKIEKAVKWQCIGSSERFIEEVNRKKQLVSNKKEKRQWIHNTKASLSSYLFTIVLFLAFLAINEFAGSSISFGEVNTMIIYIAIISSIYGMNQGIAANILAMTYLLSIYSSQNRDILTLMLDYRVMGEILICMTTALVVGYYSDKRELKVKEEKEKVEFLNSRYDFLEKLSQDVFAEKVELERQILNSENSIGKLYAIISRLDSLETEDILNNAISVLEEILDNDTIAIYSISRSGEYMRLEVQSNNDSCNMEKSIRLNKSSEIYIKLLKDNFYINKRMDKEVPQVIGAICDGNKIKAVVTINEIEFEKMNLYYENILKITIKLISAAISKAIAYQSVINSEKYIGNTKILNEKNFGQVLAIKLKAQEEKHSSLAVLELSENRLQEEEISSLLENALRETDYFGYFKGKINIILSNADQDGINVVRKRLEESGIIIREVSEEVLCLN